MRIGITGAKGFIGSHIAAALKEKKNVKISFFDLPEGNLLESGEALKKFVKGKDAIIHAAAINRGTNTEVVAGSVVATYNLISVTEKLKIRPKLIFLSSIQVEIGTLYGKSKELAEIMLEDFSSQYKIPVSIFRLTNVFGEGCRPFYNSVMATFCYQVANGQELTINPQSRNKKFNLIYVGDVAKMIKAETFRRRKSPFYFKRIDSKNKITIAELAKLIQSFKNPEKMPKLKLKFERDLYKTYLLYQRKSVL